MLPFLYGLLFTVVVSPIETSIRWAYGRIFGTWDSFNEHWAAGALFACSAILACDILIRAALLNSDQQNKHALTYQRLHYTAFIIFIICLVFFGILVSGSIFKFKIIDPGGYLTDWGPKIFFGVTISISFIAIWLDKAEKKRATIALARAREMQARLNEARQFVDEALSQVRRRASSPPLSTPPAGTDYESYNV